MGKKYKIVYDRDNCIGAAACVAVNPEYWVLKEDGKASIVMNKKPEIKKGNGVIEEAIIDEKDLQTNIEAANVCPVRVIKIIDIETGKEVAPQ